MTVFQLNRPQVHSTVASPAADAWKQQTTTAVVDRPGRHAAEGRVRLTLRRMFYTARHSARV
ncbi:hypothetical protein M6D93_10595 [Jatrophihabitans telluris]|uniref:Uncharacterized protein n=1 Tax=Jatrophihabitans telluris TaxID=2038343 RepID=A0ABY4QSB3_9ACTN|nr:hypothetical protein [Jatrophihabitans telluris]UQX86756.1 hypothetical protein M6D93_10595 [Jatrophihabitans telluris]